MVNRSVDSIWERVLQDTSEQGKLHKQLSEMLTISIMDKIKSSIDIKVESKKSHLEFAEKYHQIADKLKLEVEKLRSSYDSACFAVDIAKDKFDRSRMDSSAERNKLQWHQEILEMHNLKNEYLLALNCYNKLLDHGRDVDLPTVTGQFENYAVDANNKLLGIWKSIKTAESEIFRGLVDVSNNTLFSIEHANPELGTEIDKSNIDFDTMKLAYVPCQLWKDDVNYID